MPMMKVDEKLTKAQIKRYDKWMDSECVPICDALNTLPGIETFESCCGHKEHKFMIFFEAKEIENLRPLLIAINDRSGWTVEAAWASGGGALYFGLFGHNYKKDLYKEANEIAKALK